MNEIVVNGQTFNRVGWVSKSGKILEEFYFAADKSNVKVTIDYTYTKKGYK